MVDTKAAMELHARLLKERSIFFIRKTQKPAPKNIKREVKK